MATRSFASLDQHFRCRAEYELPDRYRHLFDAVAGAAAIPQGAGLSYVAASFGEGVKTVGMGRFNRLLAFDAEAGVIEAEAGTTLQQLYDFLLPRGFVVPVQPGYPHLTLGGLVAANAHGKNQFREGVFAGIVESLVLYHPDHGVLNLSAAENPEIFELTCGGFGLTGVILSVRVRLERLAGEAVETRNVAVGSLAETRQYLVERGGDCDLLMSWNDLARRGAAMGQGFVTTGTIVAGAPRSRSRATCAHLDPHDARRLRPPVFNALTMPLINCLYRWKELGRTGPRAVDLYAFLFPVAGAPFYFDWYGRRGLIEHQVLIPHASADDYFEALAGLIRAHGVAVPRASMKLFRGQRKLLHYNGDGVSLSMDLFNRPETLAFLGELDALDGDHGAIANLIKDSRLTAEVVRRQYAGYDAFRGRLHGFDPARRFNSALSRRLEL